MKRLRQVGDLRRPTSLEALVDRPRVTGGFGDQRRDAYVPELHRIARSIGASRSSMSLNSLSPEPGNPASTNIATPSELV
jgi:hypothetical protein